MSYQICTRCVMDNVGDADIVFDTNGICNYCLDAENNLPKYNFTKEEALNNLEKLKTEIKSAQIGEYDCVVGLSGGVDSSYVALLAKRLGLNPLCVHFDNGWNSEIAVNNIKKIIQHTGFDLETYVINWPEFKDMQRSFFKAGVIDIELLTDHAILATMFKIRKEYKIKYVLSGANYRTEHGLPPSWVWDKRDLRNIRSIQKRFGKKKIKEFPTIGVLKMMITQKYGIGGIYVEPLNVINYNKTAVMDELKEEFGWQYYGGKHYESIFTKFYQAYILPRKFNVDKRKVHFSALIRNNEIKREEALIELAKDSYDPSELAVDKNYVLKKLDFTEDEFEKMMQEKPHRHSDYPSIDVRKIYALRRKILGLK